MLFKREFHAGLRSGAITMTFRRWARPQARTGGTCKTPAGLLAIDDVREVTVRSIRTADAKKSGFSDRAALLETLDGSSGELAPGDKVYRVSFHFAGAVEAPAKDAQLSAEEVRALIERLEKMDRLSGHGPWIRRALELIRDHPKTRAPDLAVQLGRETRAFKADVRKLKKLGLTTSFEVGYEVTPRGRLVLRRWRH